MSRLYQQPTTKPIPAGATIVNCKGGVKLAKWTDARGKEHKALLNLAGDRIRVLSRKWYGEWRDADGRLVREALSPDKRAAQLMLNERVREAEMGKAGVRDPFAAHTKRTLANHLEDFDKVLRARGGGDEHVKQTVGYVRAVFEGCGFGSIADVSASAVEGYLAGLRQEPELPTLDSEKDWYRLAEVAEALGCEPHCVQPLVKRHRLAAKGYGRSRRFPRATVEALAAKQRRGKSVKTTNMYLAAVKQFCRWLVEDRRTADNPLVALKRGNVRLDRRHDRRALSAAELRLVLDATRASEATFRGLTGADRFHLYLTACGTGYRAEELASLAPESFDLDATPPTATLPARLTKNKTTATQPLPPDTADALRAYLAGKPSGKPVWPGLWFERAAEMFQADLETVGIPYSVEGPEGPLYADFHALRHSFIALLEQSGASVKQAMTLARHSDPRLTMAVYGKLRLHDVAGAVENLPPLLPTQAPKAAEKAG